MTKSQAFAMALNELCRRGHVKTDPHGVITLTAAGRAAHGLSIDGVVERFSESIQTKDGGL